MCGCCHCLSYNSWESWGTRCHQPWRSILPLQQNGIPARETPLHKGKGCRSMETLLPATTSPKTAQPNQEGISLCLHESWPRSRKNFGEPKFKACCWWAQQKTPQTQSQLLQAGQFCKFRNGTNAACWMPSLLFHLSVPGITITLSFTEGQNLLFHFYSSSGFAFKSIFKNNQNYKSISSSGFEPQSPFLSILHITITNCSESGKQSVWQADVPSAWTYLSQISVAVNLNSCLPSHQKMELPSTWSKRQKSHLLRAVKKKPPS